jgi:cell division protease FtsH
MRFLPGTEPYERDYSEETARAIDAEVRRLVEESHARAMSILRDRRAELEAIGRELLVRETLDRAELESLAAPRSERRPAAAAS